VRAYDASVHGAAHSAGKKTMAECIHCHGAHDIVAAKDPRSPMYKLNAAKVCARCHKNPELGRRLGIPAKLAADTYAESIHGRQLLDKGLLVAPSCVDCHGGHDILPAQNPASKVSFFNVTRTCGTCHEGIATQFTRGAHGKLYARKDPKAPTCSSCHSAHSIQKPAPQYKLETDKRCGACHERRLATHLETFHGRAHAMGRADVAACYDCHGTHEIVPVSDPASPVSAQNKLATCRKCHAAAPANMASYWAHGDPSDRVHYPSLYWSYRALSALLLGVFGLFALHALTTSVAVAVRFRRDPRGFRELRRRRATQARTRFRPVDRFCHALTLVSFGLLVASGLPLKYHATGWAHRVFDLIGGASAARTLHRTGAVLTAVYLVVHLFSLIGPLWRARDAARGPDGGLRIGRLIGLFFGPSSPLPGPGDVRDLTRHLKWLFGRGPEPRFGRFAYWEKFDYLGLMVGLTIVGLSGVVLWIPEQVTLLLPGYVINVAQMIHSDEALLAIGFIVTFHAFHFTLLSKLLRPLLDVDVSTGPASPPQIGPQEITTDG
jgi:cytochrome b subunit of formate dehydrogenase